MNTVAIMMPLLDVFKVFDSHSRDLYGMPSMPGYCFLTSVNLFQGNGNDNVNGESALSGNLETIASPASIITKEKLKDEMNHLKKRKLDLKKRVFKRDAQGKMNVWNKGRKDLLK